MIFGTLLIVLFKFGYDDWWVSAVESSPTTTLRQLLRLFEGFPLAGSPTCHRCDVIRRLSENIVLSLTLLHMAASMVACAYFGAKDTGNAGLT
jgi:hypothetical protein